MIIEKRISRIKSGSISTSLVSAHRVSAEVRFASSTAFSLHTLCAGHPNMNEETQP